MNKLGPKEFQMKNSLKQVKTETKVTIKVTKQLTFDLKLPNLKETLTLLNLRELTCLEKLLDSETSKT